MKNDFLPKIDKPCSKQWDELTGDDARRYCSECRLHVHNLSAMSGGERAEFLRSPGRKCGAGLPAAPQGPARSLLRGALNRLQIARPALTGLAIFVALFTGGCASASRKDPNGPVPDQQTFSPVKDKDGKELMIVGMIVEERPLWKRILWPWGG